MESSFVLSKDLSGSVSHSGGSLPLYTTEGALSSFGDTRIPYLLHDDLEFIYVKSGSVQVFVNEQPVSLPSGQGMFLNSRCLHFVLQGGECEGITARIHPSIFKSGFKPCSDYYSRKFGRGEPRYILFDCSEPWHTDALKGINELRKCDLEISDRPLSALVGICRLVELVGEHIEGMEFSDKDDQDYSVYLEIVKYLHNNFSKKVNIDVMVDELNISRTKAYRLFEKFAHTSPNSYLNYYRLIVSQQKLRDTDLSIYEIASMCGFQTSSYFTKMFGKEVGVSPKVYRDQTRTKN